MEAICCVVFWDHQPDQYGVGAAVAEAASKAL